MLPPEIEVRHDREFSLTDSGRAYRESATLRRGEVTDTESAELAVLEKFEEAGHGNPSGKLARPEDGAAVLEELVRRGLLSARQVLRHRKTRTQKIVAWQQEAATGEPAANASPTAAEGASDSEEKVRAQLAAHGPLPVALSRKKAGVSRCRVSPD